MRHRWLPVLITVLPILAVACAASVASGIRWNEGEIETIRSLWIGEFEPLAPDPSNRYAAIRPRSRSGTSCSSTRG